MFKKLLFLGVTFFAVSLNAFEITRATEEDRTGIRAILEQDLDTHYIIDGPINPLDKEESLEFTLFTALRNEEYTTLIAREEGHTVGFITYKHHVDLVTTFYEWLMRERVRMVQHMGVHSNYQRQGIGTTLIEQTAQNLKQDGINYLILCVITKNEKARRFYEKQGFYITYPGQHRISAERIEELKTEPQQYYELEL